MTVSSSTNSIAYTGNGSTTVFSYNFKIFKNTDLVVTLRNNSTGVVTAQTLTTDYTVSNAGNDSGGNVTFVTAPPSGNTVLIRRELDFTQTTNYVENDSFPAQAHEDALDKLTMLTQQNDVASDRSIRKPITDDSSLTMELPASVDRADTLLGFDSSGNVQVSTSDLANVTATSAEINTLDGFTGSVDDLNYAKDLRASGVTAAEFDKIDGLTADASELNILDGATLTTAELNHVDGVTSNIQTQLDAKMPLSGGSFTGPVTFNNNVSARFGNAFDLVINSDGSDSFITEQGSGSLFIKSNGAGIVFRNSTGANYASMLESTGEAKLFHISGGSATQRLATSSVGIDVNGSTETDKLRITTSSAPSSASDTGTVGEIAWDTNYIYVCVGTDTWKRVAISTW